MELIEEIMERERLSYAEAKEVAEELALCVLQDEKPEDVLKRHGYDQRHKDDLLILIGGD